MKLANKVVNNNRDFERIFSENPLPFAIIHRPEINPDALNFFTGEMNIYETLDELHVDSQNSEYNRLVMIPFQQIKERGFEYIDDHTPLIAMDIQQHVTHDKSDILARISDSPILMENEHYDTSDEVYKNTVDRIISDEIRNGAGANFVLKRTLLADIKNYSIPKALSIFKSLLNFESGAYWTFIVYTGQRVLVGATPERHISLSDKTITMNPISGTYRYPKSGPSTDDFLAFLNNKKETEELYMVVDEELKMMSRICDSKATIYGPYIKEMANLAHTEYLIKGSTSLSPYKILKETLFAPTVTGSPLENAFRVIKKYEPKGRGYYSGIIALVGKESDGAVKLDSAIMIRTADISNEGKLKLSVGSTIVRHSSSELECLEAKAKAGSLTSAIRKIATVAKTQVNLPKQRLIDNVVVLKTLRQRNQIISKFWLQEPTLANIHINTALIGLKTLIIDAEDTFTSMLYQLLQSLGLNVMLKRFDEDFNIHDYQLTVLGPGPGDPEDKSDPRIVKITQVLNELVRNELPFLAICLSHQILCLYLGLPILLKEVPNQGTQKAIDLFGSMENVGFYNSYSGLSTNNTLLIKGIGTVEVSRDTHNREVHALRSKNFTSMQFHPESLLTQQGPDILKARLLELIDENKYSLES